MFVSKKSVIFATEIIIVRTINSKNKYEKIMIKGKGHIVKIDGSLRQKELDDALQKLPDSIDGYDFLIYDNKQNRALPNLTYLFSVVLKQISDSLPDHPSTTSLYKYFEEIFAPKHTCTINGQEFRYSDLKNEKSTDFGKVVENIVEYAQKRWNIPIVSKDELRDAKYRELYAKAYAKQEVDWSRFISSLK